MINSSYSKNVYSLFISLLIIIGCSPNSNNSSSSTKKANIVPIASSTKAFQDSIIAQVFRSTVLKKEGYFSTEWQEELDIALKKDSTIAYLWQQKAMPLFKQGKYELGMSFLDKAVDFDQQSYLDYRGFMKCIFAKQYKAAILDFQACIKQFGNSYVMDHSYSFYIALSYIQLNQFKEAESLLTAEIERQEKTSGKDWVHHLDLFYLGISQYEQNKYDTAIQSFDRALQAYPEFSDAQMYKSICLRKLNRIDEANQLRKQARQNGKDGYTINEDNVIYERYPYQIRWNS